MRGITRVMPWQPTARTGPKWGIAINPGTMARVISEAKNPLIIVGGEIDSLKGKLFDYMVKIAEKKNIKIIATADSVKKFNENKVDAVLMGVTEITNLLLDPEWSINGEPHDLAIFAGIQYNLNAQIFNALKNFSKVKTANISRYYQPNASVSFPNLTEEIWEEYLQEVCEKVR